MDINMHAGNSYLHIKKFCVPVSIGASKGDQSLKMPSDSISESVIFQNFLGVCPIDPPSVGMLCMPMCFSHYDSAYPSYPTST